MKVDKILFVGIFVAISYFYLSKKTQNKESGLNDFFSNNKNSSIEKGYISSDEIQQQQKRNETIRKTINKNPLGDIHLKNVNSRDIKTAEKESIKKKKGVVYYYDGEGELMGGTDTTFKATLNKRGAENSLKSPLRSLLNRANFNATNNTTNKNKKKYQGAVNSGGDINYFRNTGKDRELSEKTNKSEKSGWFKWW